MYVCHICAVPAEARRPLGLLHLRLLVAVSCQALSLPELCSALLSCLSSPQSHFPLQHKTAPPWFFLLSSWGSVALISTSDLRPAGSAVWLSLGVSKQRLWCCITMYPMASQWFTVDSSLWQGNMGAALRELCGWDSTPAWGSSMFFQQSGPLFSLQIQCFLQRWQLNIIYLVNYAINLIHLKTRYCFLLLRTVTFGPSPGLLSFTALWIGLELGWNTWTLTHRILFLVIKA